MCGLSLHRPRRIFRASTRGQGLNGFGLGGDVVRRAVLAGLVGTVFGAVVMLLVLPSDLFGRVPPLAGTITAAPELVAVVDGETLRLREMVVRLQGVAAPPRGLSCRAANGSVSDCGAASATALAALVRGHGVACRLHGRDSAGLAQGVCDAAGTELNRALVAAGWARALDASGMDAAETEARAARRGLWRDGAMPGF
jgi:endonuclease YncB( thermonuclease family)